MRRVVSRLSISLDGFVAGRDQSPEDPLGVGGEQLHRWMFESDHHADRDAVEEMSAGIGAYVMGRNMFGPPGGGGWDASWRGWWGDDPPYHVPVFVLTHHPREPLEMEGGTTFNFVTDGIEAALERARAAAGEQDVMIAGGASAVQQYLAAGLLDELFLHIAPVLLGAGERLLDGVGEPTFEPVEARHSPLATHVRYRIAR